jgi:hypothetical protein
MGDIKKSISKAVKESGSKANARRDSEKWYTAALNNFQDGSVVKSSATRFMPGKIYVFRYDNPKTIEDLDWWDRNPIILALDPVGTNDCGINLNLLPIKIKEQLLDDIYSRMAGQIKTRTTRAQLKADLQAPLSLSYSGAKNYLNRYGFGFAVRQYIPQRKTKQAVVSYENWWRIALCDFIQLEGSTIQSVRRQFSSYFKK